MKEIQIIDELVSTLKDILTERYGIDVDITSQTVTKINNTQFQGLLVKEPGSQVAATMYIDDALKDMSAGLTSVPEVAENLADRYYNLSAQQDLPQIMDINFENAKEKLFCEAVNFASNRNLLEDVPYRKIEDIAIIARYRVTPEASFIVHNAAADKMGMSHDEIVEQAILNSLKDGFQVQSLNSVISDLMGPMNMPFPMPEESPVMYVISNADKHFGASGIFIDRNLRSEIRDLLGGDVTILPSSIHECLAIKDDGQNLSVLQTLVNEVNSTQVSPEEVLSGNIYRIDQTLNLKLYDGEQNQHKETDVVTNEIQTHRAFAM